MIYFSQSQWLFAKRNEDRTTSQIAQYETFQIIIAQQVNWQAFTCNLIRIAGTNALPESCISRTCVCTRYNRSVSLQKPFKHIFFMGIFHIANRIKTARYNKYTDLEKCSKETSMSVNLLIDFSRGSYKMERNVKNVNKCFKKFLWFFS